VAYQLVASHEGLSSMMIDWLIKMETVYSSDTSVKLY
jgi:hypothetical protein